MTREQWLQAGTDAMRGLFVAAGHELPSAIHTSIGFPSKAALSRTRRVVGQCWGGKHSSDGNCHIFISPVLITPVEILDTLAHELSHVVTPGAGHKGKFITVSRAIGLTENKPTSAAAGPELRRTLERIASEIGTLTHPALAALGAERSKQSTRMMKCECPDCGYTVRTSRKWLDIAAPLCPICRVDMETIDRLNGDSLTIQ
jgi:hypothetical protein